MRMDMHAPVALPVIEVVVAFLKSPYHVVCPTMSLLWPRDNAIIPSLYVVMVCIQNLILASQRFCPYPYYIRNAFSNTLTDEIAGANVCDLHLDEPMYLFHV